MCNFLVELKTILVSIHEKIKFPDKQENISSSMHFRPLADYVARGVSFQRRWTPTCGVAGG